MVIFYFLAKLKGFKIKKRKINKIKSGCVVIDAPKHNTLRRELPGTTPARITTPHTFSHTTQHSSTASTIFASVI